MISAIRFSPDFKVKLAESYEWYEGREIGLGQQFLRSVDVCLKMVQRHPEIFPIIVKTYRRAIPRKFPYVIFYKIEGDMVIVYQMFHSAENPKKWSNRLE
jgi:toxin ParE1/3/4